MQLFTKSHIPLFLLGLVYLFTRLYNLLLLPIFTDESIYIYWSKVIQTTHSQWGLSLTDGKPPLLTWIIAIFLQIFPSDWYLLAGRLPSVLFGLITLLGIYKLTKLLFIERVTRGGEPHGRGPLVGGHGAAEWQDPRNRAEKIALLAGVLYILNPFSLLYDRLALFDSLLTSMTIWTVIYTIK
ncbi:glycosyltransferase family 39 protein, partial [Candidatus Gottesmanbacteria bacterium]|nr:glycosyltransferase family 39 protein [Candidatus Gottesmanbacteria bacterium]